MRTAGAAACAWSDADAVSGSTGEARDNKAADRSLEEFPHERYYGDEPAKPTKNRSNDYDTVGRSVTE